MSERVKVTSKTPESKRDNSVSQTRKIDFSQSTTSPIDHILFLQRNIGNQAIQRLFKSGVIQAKLKIGQPNDIYEQKADRVAEQVTSQQMTTVPMPISPMKNSRAGYFPSLSNERFLRRQEPSASSSSATNPSSNYLTPEEGAKIIAAAKTWLGVKYLYGGDSREGIDCSHFVHRAYVEAGFDYDYLSTSALPQSPNFDPVGIPQAGDLILFQGHVGIYNPKAPDPGKTVLNAGTKGVHYGRPSWYTGPYTYYRYFKTVTATTGSSLQRKTAICDNADGINVVNWIHHKAIQEGGGPLPSAERSFFEPRFGIDLSEVRVYTGRGSEESARAINALAYTVGKDIVFGAGQYRPQTLQGKRLLAHELTHVLQQSNSIGPKMQKFTAELDAGKGISISPEDGDSDADLDRVLCAKIKERNIAGRKKIDVTGCFPKGTIKAMEIGENCAGFVRHALGHTPPKSGLEARWFFTAKLWEELLKAGYRIRSFGVLRKDGKVEAAKGLSWEQLAPRMGDLVFMKGAVIVNKAGEEPNPTGDNFRVTWDHVGFFIVRSRKGFDYHLADDGDENPIGVYRTGLELSEGLEPGAYVKGTDSLLAYIDLPSPEEKEETETREKIKEVHRRPVREEEEKLRHQPMEEEKEVEEILQGKELARKVREETPAVAQKVIDVIGEQKWISLVELRQKSAGNDEIVIVELLRALQPRLVHVSGKEEVGVPSKLPSHPGKIPAACHYTTKLIVNGLRALGIAAKYRNTNEILPYESVHAGHAFPVFPTIGKGLSHGDDLYHRPIIKDPGKMLYSVDEILVFWKQLHDISEKVRGRLSEKLMGGGTLQEREHKKKIVAAASWAERVDIEVPADTPEKSIVLKAKEALVNTPAPLVVELNRQYSGLRKQFTRLQQTLRLIPWYIERPRWHGLAKQFLPERLHRPHLRLPKERREAIEIVINILRSKVVRRPMIKEAIKELPSPASLALKGGTRK